jgi:glycosyltransferase involved in cell wall biosynthesis
VSPNPDSKSSDSAHIEATVSLWRERYSALVADREQIQPRPKAKWSFVVVTWCGGDLLLKCLDRIVEQQGFDREELEVILVDNGGLSVTSALRQRVDMIIHMRQNSGCSTGRNVGAAWATAPMLSFIDDDGLVDPNYAINASNHLQQANVVALRGRVVARAHRYFTTLAGHYDRGPAVIDECLTAEGTMAICRATFLSADGFPDGMVGHEGIHLSYRILNQKPGARLIYAPDVVLAHDYMKSWRHFVRKSANYACLDSRAMVTDPELAAFVANQLSKKFPRPQRSPDEYVARAILLTMRKAIVLGVRLGNSLH